MKKLMGRLSCFAMPFSILFLMMIAVAGCKKTDLAPATVSSVSANDVSAASSALSGFKEVDLTANKPGFHANNIDPRLKNAWGMFADDEGEIWVSANGSGLSFVYDRNGNQLMTHVTIPTHKGGKGAPTGTVYNETSDFIIPGTNTPAEFLFADEKGTVSAWNDPTGSTAVKVADKTAFDAVFKGIAIAEDGGANFIYVTDFANAKIDVLDKNFNRVSNKPFLDPVLPKNYAPFGIKNVDGMLYVTYALQKADKEDDSSGAGRGIVDVYWPNGTLQQRFATHGKLNSPWGITKTRPDSNGSSIILIGNFGDGHINAFDTKGHFMGQLSNNGQPIAIDGLWAIDNRVDGTNAQHLYFTAGPNDEADGLFGYLLKQ